MFKPDLINSINYLEDIFKKEKSHEPTETLEPQANIEEILCDHLSRALQPIDNVFGRNA